MEGERVLTFIGELIPAPYPAMSEEMSAGLSPARMNSAAISNRLASFAVAEAIMLDRADVASGIVVGVDVGIAASSSDNICNNATSPVIKVSPSATRTVSIAATALAGVELDEDSVDEDDLTVVLEDFTVVLDDFAEVLLVFAEVLLVSTLEDVFVVARLSTSIGTAEASWLTTSMPPRTADMLRNPGILVGNTDVRALRGIVSSRGWQEQISQIEKWW